MIIDISMPASQVSRVLREDGDDPFELEGVEIGLVLLVKFLD